MRYENVQVHISDGQKDKVKRALESENGVSIRLGYDDMTGEDVLALTQRQKEKLVKAYENKKGITIKMSKTQVAFNKTVKGGFLPLLLGLAAKVLPILTGTVLPALGVGALSGLASTGVQKIMGNGLYLKKGGCVCRIETDGEGLYLGRAPSENGLAKYGDGLYLSKRGQISDGRGLLLGENSPFKNIPILNLLL